LRRRILASSITPARCVLLAGSAVQLGGGLRPAGASPEPQLELEIHGSKRRIERAQRELESLAQAAGSKAEVVEPAQADAAWARVTDVEPWVSKDFPGALVLKATLPDSAVEEWVSRAEQEAQGEKAQCAIIAQLGVGIARLCMLSGLEAELQSALIRRLRAAAESLGGALVIERAPRAVKDQFDVWGSFGSDFAVMKKMKQVWDPQGTLSPGRMLGHL